MQIAEALWPIFWSWAISQKHTNMSRIFVAMSGGVDSSVAAALMKEQGHEVIGVTMCLGIDNPLSKRMACCSTESIEDARNVCRTLDIKHHVFSFMNEMREYIIDHFVSEYSQGRTPNPCVRCNQFLKFGKLLQQARAIGAEYIATGHYAKIERVNDKNAYVVRKGKDTGKDQTYFLYTVRKDDLPHILFPLGGMEKARVRELARGFRLPVAEKTESQDICFVPDGGYVEFIRTRRGDAVFKPGAFIDADGKMVGEHKGMVNYTIGQREKLGIALGYPAYVFKMDMIANTVHVGPKELLYSKILLAGNPNFMVDDVPEEITAKIRYQAKDARARLERQTDGRLKVVFEQAVMAATPGQSVVFYDGDILLGGATIEEVI